MVDGVAQPLSIICRVESARWSGFRSFWEKHLGTRDGDTWPNRDRFLLDAVVFMSLTCESATRERTARHEP